jgi:DNA-binding beta-propeller fold protein YncE
LSLLILSFLVGATASAQMPKFKNIANIHVGEEAAAEIVAFSKNTQTLWVLNSPNSTIDAYDFADPAKPILKYLSDYSDLGGGVTSVAVYGDYIAIALSAEVKQDAGKVLVLNAAEATVLKEFTAEALPDMLTFSHDGTYIVAANEGEPNDAYNNDPRCLPLRQ